MRVKITTFTDIDTRQVTIIYDNYHHKNIYLAELTSMFSLKRFVLLVFGMTIIFRWIWKRSTTWAGVFKCFFAMAFTTSFSNTLVKHLSP